MMLPSLLTDGSDPALMPWWEDAATIAAIDSTMLMSELDHRARVRWMNDRLLQYLGVASEQVRGRLLIELLTGETQDGCAALLARSREGRPWRGVIPCSRPSGEAGWLEVLTFPVIAGATRADCVQQNCAQSGGVRRFGRTLGLALDATETINRRQAWEALTTGIDDHGNAVVVSSPDGTIQYANESFRRLFCRAGDVVVGRDLRRALAWRTNDSDGQVDEYLAQRTAGDDGVHAEIEVRDEDSRPVWVAAQANPVRDDQGNIASVVDVFTDITAPKLYEVLQRQVLGAMLAEMSLHETVGLLCREIRRLAPEVSVAVLSIDAGDCVRVAGMAGMPVSYLKRVDGVELAQASFTWMAAATASEPVVIGNVVNDPAWQGQAQALNELGVQAAWSQAIKSADSRVIGVLALYFPMPRLPDPYHLRLAEVALPLCALALERETSRTVLQRLSLYDPLTGLPNRSLLYSQLEQAIDDMTLRGGQLAVMVIDIDRFKEVNDALGNKAGDVVLREYARRLGAAVRSGDIVGRLGGDQFMVVLLHCDARGVAMVGKHLRSEMARDMQVESQTLAMTVSAGISLFPDNGRDINALTKHAEFALAQAKEEGRNRSRFFSPTLNQQAKEKRALELDLRRALDRGDLRLQYQPQVLLDGGGLHGVEALARWTHPERGRIGPDVFVALAEETGLIKRLSEWALLTACAQLARWRANGLLVPSISVNLSPSNFHQSDLLELVDRALRENGLTPGDLTLEMTESVLLRRQAETTRNLSALAERGVRLSMDDFGTGYSSLGHLQRMPVSELKIDRSFVSGLVCEPTSRTLTSAIIRIGESLRMTVVAEGVETEAQRDILRMEGCLAAQGYFYARPMVSDDAEAWFLTYGQSVTDTKPE